MSTNQGQITVNNVKIIETDTDPTGAGLSAEVGSIAVATDGLGAFYKNASGDTNWSEVVFSLSAPTFSAVTLDQGAADTNISELKSSDVAHGMTNIASTDVYNFAKKFGAAEGGLLTTGLSESVEGYVLRGYSSSTNVNTDTGARGGVVLINAIKSGAGVTAVASTANIITIRNNTLTRILGKGNGDFHAGLGNSSAVFGLNGTQVLTTRRTGWAAPTGTAARTTYATFAGQTITNPPTQAEVQAIDDHLVILSQRLKALIDDLTTHGVIGT